MVLRDHICLGSRPQRAGEEIQLLLVPSEKIWGKTRIAAKDLAVRLSVFLLKVRLLAWDSWAP